MNKQCWGWFCLVALMSMVLFSMPAKGEWDDRFTQPKITYLNDILKNPQGWLNIPVRIPLRFSRIGNIYNMFFTQFDDHYVNFAAWDTQTHIWEKDGFTSDYAHFYMEKDNPELKALLKLRTFDTISVMAKVTGIFRQKPYIRVVWLCHIPGTLNVDNLRLLYKGMTAFHNRKFDDAQTIFQEAINTDLPADLQVMLYKTMAKIDMYEKKQYTVAMEKLEAAIDINPNDIEANELHKRCAHFLEVGGTPPAPIYWEQPVETPQAKPEQKPEPKEQPPVTEPMLTPTPMPIPEPQFTPTPEPKVDEE